jgi:hypothetical protein
MIPGTEAIRETETTSFDQMKEEVNLVTIEITEIKVKKEEMNPTTVIEIPITTEVENTTVIRLPIEIDLTLGIKETVKTAEIVKTEEVQKTKLIQRRSTLYMAHTSVNVWKK